jgi:hypothetical protein
MTPTDDQHSAIRRAVYPLDRPGSSQPFSQPSAGRKKQKPRLASFVMHRDKNDARLDHAECARRAPRYVDDASFDEGTTIVNRQRTDRSRYLTITMLPSDRVLCAQVISPERPTPE